MNRDDIIKRISFLNSITLILYGLIYPVWPYFISYFVIIFFFVLMRQYKKKKEKSAQRPLKTSIIALITGLSLILIEYLAVKLFGKTILIKSYLFIIFYPWVVIILTFLLIILNVSFKMIKREKAILIMLIISFIIAVLYITRFYYFSNYLENLYLWVDIKITI